jgi:hypothetical protein
MATKKPPRTKKVRESSAERRARRTVSEKKSKAEARLGELFQIREAHEEGGVGTTDVTQNPAFKDLSNKEARDVLRSMEKAGHIEKTGTKGYAGQHIYRLTGSGRTRYPSLGVKRWDEVRLGAEKWEVAELRPGKKVEVFRELPDGTEEKKVVALKEVVSKAKAPKPTPKKPPPKKVEPTKAKPPKPPPPPPRKPPKVPEMGQRLLEAHLRQLGRHVESNGVKGLEPLYKSARADLYDQLTRAGGPMSKTATATQLKAMIAQIDATLEALGGRIHKHLRDVAGTAAELGAKHGSAEFKALAKHFTGTEPVLSVDRAAVFGDLVKDVNSSLLKRYQIVSKTWSQTAIMNIERALSVGTLAGKPLEDVIDDVMGKTGILEDERWKAERIVRTESAYAHGATKHRTMEKTQEDLGRPLHKRLIATFYDRTGDDSFLVHGQTVPVSKPFSWKHKRRGQWVVTRYMHPPNRPNDREVVIPWDPEWEETDAEAPLSKAELAAARTTRWRKHIGVDIPPGHRPGKPY